MNKKIMCDTCLHKNVCYMLEISNDIEHQLEEFGCKDYLPNLHGCRCNKYKSGTPAGDGVVSSCRDMWSERKTAFCPYCVIKEFAERLKTEWWNNRYESPDVDFNDYVDNLTREMVGGK